MKKAILLLALLLSSFVLVHAQPGPASAPRYMGKRTADPATCSEGSWYYNTTSHAFKYCSAANTWSALGGSSGITVGSTSSNGTANTLLKTNGSSQVADATGVTQPAGFTQKNIIQTNTDVGLDITGAASQSGNYLECSANGGSAADTCKITNAGRIFAKDMFSVLTNSDITFGDVIGTGDAVYGVNNNKYYKWRDNNGNFPAALAASAVATPNFRIPSGYQFGFSSSSTDAGTAADTGIQRVAAKVVSVTDGSSGGGWIQTGGDSRVSSNVTNATATMANITGLSATVIAGRKYAGSIVLIAKNSTAAEGLQFDFNGGGATFTNIQFLFQGTPIGATLGVTTSSAAGTALTATTATTGDIAYTIYFTIVCNAGGTVIPRFAEVTHTSGTATVELGSSMRLEDIP